MIRPTRLGAAATIAALGVSVATPAIDSALAAPAPAPHLTTALPTEASLEAALLALNPQAPSSDITDAAQDITNLASDGVSTTALQTLDSDLNGVVSGLTTTVTGLLDSVFGLVGGLLGGTATPPAADTLQATITALQQQATGATAAVQQAVGELTTALDNAGLSTLLSGLDSPTVTSALSQLNALQSLAPGASSPAGSLSAVATLVSTLSSAAGTGTGDGTTLAGVAALLSSSSPLTPATLEQAIDGLLSVTSTSTPNSTSGSYGAIAQALAAQLAQSGSLLGGLAAVGSPLSALTPSQSSSTSPLNTALAELTTLANLPSSSSSLPQMPGLSAVLADLASAPGVSSISVPTQSGGSVSLSTLLTDVSGLFTTSGLQASALSGLGGVLSGVASYLPAPLSTTVAGLGTLLTGDAAQLVGTAGGSGSGSGSTGSGSGSGSTGGSSSSTGTKSGGTGGTSSSGTSSSASAAAAGTKVPIYHWGIITKTKRGGTTATNTVTVTLYCLASAGQTCTAKLHATEKLYRQANKTVRLSAGKTDKVTLKLKQIKPKAKRGHKVAKAKKVKRAPVKLTVTSSSYHKAATLK